MPATVHQTRETMRSQWRTFETALREQLAPGRSPSSQAAVAAALAAVEADYLARAQPEPPELPTNIEGDRAQLEVRFVAAVRHLATQIDVAAWALLVPLLLAELNLAELGPPAAGWPALPAELAPVAHQGAAVLPNALQRDWSAFSEVVRRHANGTGAAEVDGALRTVAPAWLACMRELPAYTFTGDTEALLQHVDAWGRTKQMAVLLALARARMAEHWLRLRGELPEPLYAPDDVAELLPFAPRDKPQDKPD